MKKETTEKVKRLRDTYSDEELSMLIGISLPTLYTRLNRNNWKLAESLYINSLK